jgi:hypothetical protein
MAPFTMLQLLRHHNIESLPVQNIQFMAPFTALFTVSQPLRHYNTKSLPIQNIRFMAPFTVLFTVSQPLRHHTEPACTKYSIYGPIYCPIHCVAIVATPQYGEPAYKNIQFMALFTVSQRTIQRACLSNIFNSLPHSLCRNSCDTAFTEGLGF